jgi:asparagine synthase (glutamine-hydrolysing)
MMAVDYETYMLDDILQKVDRATMSTSLEGREPFLDHHIADWAAVLPVNLKYNNGDKKHIIKQLVHKYIPKEMMERPKMGFAIPIKEWMENGFKDMVCTYLDDAFLDKQGIFNKKEVKSLLKGFYEEKKVPPEKLWYLFMFQLWFSRWMSE